MFATGAPLAGSAYYDGMPDGGCYPFAQPWDSGIFSVGAELPPATFPELKEEWRGGRLQMRFYTAEGVTMGWNADSVFDRKLDTPCSVKVAADGQLRCVPHNFGRMFYYPEGLRSFSDAACTQEVLGGLAPPACGPDATPNHYAASHVDCNGAAPAHAYALGDALPSTTTFYTKQGANCVASTSSPNPAYEYRPVLGEVDPKTMAAVTEVAR